MRVGCLFREPDERTSDEAAAAAQPSTEGSVTDATASAPVSIHTRSRTHTRRGKHEPLKRGGSANERV